MNATDTPTLPAPQDRVDGRDHPRPRTSPPDAPRPALDLQRRLVSRLVG
jgi:hypothetical protein